MKELLKPHRCVNILIEVNYEAKLHANFWLTPAAHSKQPPLGIVKYIPRDRVKL